MDQTLPEPLFGARAPPSSPLSLQGLEELLGFDQFATLPNSTLICPGVADGTLPSTSDGSSDAHYQASTNTLEAMTSYPTYPQLHFPEQALYPLLVPAPPAAMDVAQAPIIMTGLTNSKGVSKPAPKPRRPDRRRMHHNIADSQAELQRKLLELKVSSDQNSYMQRKTSLLQV